MNTEDNPWKKISEETVYETPWFKVFQHKVVNPAGKPDQYSYVHYNKQAVGILPLDENLNTWLVGQWRYPIGKYLWEIPAGGGILDESPLEIGKRELLEETGITAKKWTKIQTTFPAKSCTDEIATLYIAQDLAFEAPQPDEAEDLKLFKIPFEKLYGMVVNGAIEDALTIIAVLKTKVLLDNKKI